MDILKIAAQLFINKMGATQGKLDIGSVIGGLKDLLPTQGDDLDISSLVSNFTKNAGLASLASSWLGNGKNEGISAQQIMQVFGKGKIEEFASKIGVDSGNAASGLASMIPDLIDKSSENGNLLNNLKSGIGSKLLKGLF